jgi:glutathione S-transferase
MTITFYYGSGSPFAWYVWLVLEHKQLPYELKLMSLLGGDLKTPDYLAMNPRGKVPVLIDDGFVLSESTAIVEYLEEVYRDRPLLPSSAQGRAIARRIVAEAHSYVYPPIRRLMEQTVFRTDGKGDSAIIEQSLNDLKRELAYFEGALQSQFFLNSLSTADLAFYPLLALVRRLLAKYPQFSSVLTINHNLTAFMHQIEQLPYFAKTIPPHWQE